jgi:hypothetical protein
MVQQDQLVRQVQRVLLAVGMAMVLQDLLAQRVRQVQQEVLVLLEIQALQVNHLDFLALGTA